MLRGWWLVGSDSVECGPAGLLLAIWTLGGSTAAVSVFHALPEIESLRIQETLYDSNVYNITVCVYWKM